MTTTERNKPNSDGKSASPLRVLLYSRVSSTQQAQHGHSIESQPEALKAFSKAKGWRIVGESTDSGKTGRNADREGFKALMESIEVSRPDAVVVTRLSRFMRNARLTLNAIHEMRELGVALICTDEPIDTRQRGIGDMFLAILATMAEWESDRLSEYARDSKARLVAKGRWPGGRTPYGYIFNKETGQLVLVPERAEVVNLIFSLYTERRLGAIRIRRELADRMIRAPGGGRLWGTQVIHGILANEVYTGRHALGIEAPLIISTEVFDRAQTLRRSNHGLHPPRKDTWPLQNRLKCCLCGSTVRCVYSHGIRRYRCEGRGVDSRYYLETGERCTLPIRQGEELEEKLRDGLAAAISDPANLVQHLERALAEMQKRAAELERDVFPLEHLITDINEQLSRLAISWVRGDIPVDRYEKERQELLERQERTQVRLDSLPFVDRGQIERSRQAIKSAEKVLQDVRQAGGDPRVFGDDSVILVPIGPLSSDWPRPASDNRKVTLKRFSREESAAHLSHLMDQIQGEVFLGAEHMDLRGLIQLRVPTPSAVGSKSNGYQASTSPS